MLRYRCGEKPHQNHQLWNRQTLGGKRNTRNQPHTNINTLIGRPAPSPPRATKTQLTAGPGPRALSGMLPSLHRPQQQIILLDGTQVSIDATQELPIAGRHKPPRSGHRTPAPCRRGRRLYHCTIPKTPNTCHSKYTARSRTAEAATGVTSCSDQPSPCCLSTKSRRKHYSAPVSVARARHWVFAGWGVPRQVYDVRASQASRVPAPGCAPRIQHRLYCHTASGPVNSIGEGEIQQWVCGHARG